MTYNNFFVKHIEDLKTRVRLRLVTMGVSYVLLVVSRMSLLRCHTTK